MGALSVISMTADLAMADSDLFPLGSHEETPPLATTPAPYQADAGIPSRPAPPLEIGDPFLSTGPLFAGIDMPGGATWQPRLWVFGTMRSAIQTYETGLAKKNNVETTEWANRLDLNANLQLTGTERLFLGLRPFDRDHTTEFSGYTFSPSQLEGGHNDFNGNVRTLFFEGDVGSTLPTLDQKGVLPVDFGYSVGRQPVNFQNGILINDTIDAVGLVRNSIHFPGTSNVRITAMAADNNLHRPNLPNNTVHADLYGLFTTADVEETTFDLDLIGVTDKRSAAGDAFYEGADIIRRYDVFNIALRANSSIATEKATTASTDGTLLSGEFSFSPYRSDDLVYFNPYVAFGTFTQASRDPIVGGPLAPLGILYTAYGIGTIPSALSSSAQDVAGFALGYQAFWDEKRQNLTIELGGRDITERVPGVNNAIGVGAQFQQAIGQRVILQLNATVTAQEYHTEAYGLRGEIFVQF
jgi:hypothetical protein